MSNSLVLKLVADANPMMRTLDSVQKRMDAFTRSADRAGASLGGGMNRSLEAFTGLARGGASAAGVLAGGLATAAAAAVVMATRAGDQVEELHRLSQKTGIALQSIQRLSVVMAENNFEAGALTQGMRKLTKHVTEARNPASAAATMFEDMGISITQLGSTEDVIRAVADRFAAMPDGIEKSHLAIELFGESGLHLIPVLNRGSAAFDKSAKSAQRFGVVLSTEQVSALEGAADASARMGVALQGLQQQFAATFASSVTSGIDAVTEGIATLTRITQNYATALEQVKKEHPVISSFSPGMAGALAATRAAQMPPGGGGISPGGPQDAHVAAFTLDNQEQQVEAGLRLRRTHIEAWKAAEHAGKAQEALGRVTLEIIQRENYERNQAFGLMVEEQERVRLLNLELSKVPTTGPFIEAIEKKEAAIRNLTNLMPELSRDDAIHLYSQNQTQAEATIRAATTAWEHRNDVLVMAAERSRTVDAAQQALFQSEAGMLGASAAARRVRMQLIEAEGALEKQTIEETIFNEVQKNAALLNLDTELETRRRQAIQEFPTIWEQQLQTIVASNTFSVGMIVSGWTSGIAQAIVNFENFGQAMEQIGKQTAATLLQGILTHGVQAAGLWALQSAHRIGLETATASAVVGINTAKNAAVVASDAAAAGTTTTIWGAAMAAIHGMFATVFAAVKGFIIETVLPAMIAVGKAVITFLSGIGAALDVSIFGIPFSVPVWAAVALIGAAIGAIAAFAFADGGIATGPTMGLIGEAGSSEAVIPLNKRGAAFMRETLGLGGGGKQEIHTHVMLDGRQIALAVTGHQPSALRHIGAMS
ncbi:MAG: hypothetical protein OEY86_07070 [Nitrospira sp.]|nr:hypothetical protein [Nitrospira sp.]